MSGLNATDGDFARFQGYRFEGVDAHRHSMWSPTPQNMSLVASGETVTIRVWDTKDKDGGAAVGASISLYAAQMRDLRDWLSEQIDDDEPDASSVKVSVHIDGKKIKSIVDAAIAENNSKLVDSLARQRR